MSLVGDFYMSVIFIGSTVDKESLKKLKAASIAGNKMQLGFIKGFLNNNIKTIAISVEPQEMWKMNNNPIFIRSKYLKDGNVEIFTISYINIPIIKQISIIINLKRKIKKIISKDEFKKSTLIVYNTMSIFANPTLKIAKQKKLLKIAIIADLPIKKKKNFVRKLEDKKQINYIKKFDALIPLTQYIAEDFAPNVPFYVIEAGCNPDDYNEKQEIFDFNKKNKVIIFSGTLNELSGIELLLETMELIEDKTIYLNIFGDGPLKKYVIEKTKNLSNVNYLGKVSNDQMLKNQKEACLLVCPRKKDDFTTKYTFPSKILEYICSGVPVLSNKLYGIPKEYEKYINFTKNETPQEWKNNIKNILDSKKYNFFLNKALEAKRICLKNKSWDNQVKNLVEYLKFKEINIENQ